jgi:hypothetical protein
LLPLEVTIEPETKFAPATCRVVSAAPACTLVGVMLVMVAATGAGEPPPPEEPLPLLFGEP